MGRLSGGVFGFPSGKAGDVIFRVRNGKVYFCAAPGSRKKEPSEKAAKILSRFAFCSSFSSAAGKIRIFRELWGNSSVEAESLHNRIMKININRVKPEYDLSGLLLTPEGEKFESSLTAVQFNGSRIFISFSPVEDATPGEKIISVQGVLLLTDPADEENKPFKLIPVYSKDEDFAPGSPLNFEINPDDYAIEMINAYRIRKIICNLIIKDLQNHPLKISAEKTGECSGG